MTTFLLWVLLLAAVLFYPVSKLIWTLSVRRMQRKLARELSQDELQGQLVRARFIGAFVALVFAFFYNLSTLGLPGGG